MGGLRTTAKDAPAAIKIGSLIAKPCELRVALPSVPLFAVSQSVSIAVLMPHAPVLVPAVGGERLPEVASTVAAMREVAARVVARGPDGIVLISPHSPREQRAFGVWMHDKHAGSLAQFHAPEARFALPNDPELIAHLETTAREAGISLWGIEEEDLDHGAAVPLWFLCEAGWSGPTTILSLNHPGQGGCHELGRAIARAAEQCGQRVAMVASGDMSHRLLPGAPGGYHPEARHFDETFIRFVQSGASGRLLSFDAALEELAGEDALDSTLVALGAAGEDMRGHRVLSYEGPFGVGYGVAILHESDDADGDPDDEEFSLPEVARLSVENALGLRDAPCQRPGTEALRACAPVFVTIRTRDGALRGCVGSVAARHASVLEETWHNARSAAFHDTRFKPVRAGELPDLVFEVSVLHSFEDLASEAELDPREHGVLVSMRDGRQGLLLPDVEGVDTADEQIAIARRKGRIGPREEARMQRFRVEKHLENEPAMATTP